MEKKTLKVKCFITGEEQIFSGDYLDKLIKKYGSKDNLKKYYISFKAKNLLYKGYSINEIRKVLVLKQIELEPSDSEKALEIIKYWQEQKNNNKFKNKNKDISLLKTDPEVKDFIENWKNYKKSK